MAYEIKRPYKIPIFLFYKKEIKGNYFHSILTLSQEIANCCLITMLGFSERDGIKQHMNVVVLVISFGFIIVFCMCRGAFSEL